MHRLLQRSIPLVLALSVFLVLPGCQNTSSSSSVKPGAIPGDSANYELKGIVVSVDPTRGEVILDAQAIPGLMGAMIMPYKLAQAGVANELHPGDHLNARLRTGNGTSLIDQIDITQQAKPDYKPAKVYNVPAPGQPVPNFQFLNQSGKTIHLEQFRGQVLLVTFIYTRCPLPDYCIRMSRQLAQVAQLVAGDPRLANKIHLLSISFDPAYDTPKVLTSYGRMYTAGGFARWDFAVPSASELDQVDQFFDVAVSAGSDNTLTHSLSTVVIAPDGKIFRWYPNNDWTPATVLGDIKHALGDV